MGKAHRGTLYRSSKWLLLIVTALGVLFLLLPTLIAKNTTSQYRRDISQLAEFERRPVTLVLGAGVFPDGTPTPYLQNRIETATEMYRQGKTDTLLMSGDNSSDHYNEPVAMARYAESIGIPRKAIVLDYAGLSTYDSCYRAQAIFGVEKMYVVTQGYHLPRAVFNCRNLGIDTIGVAAQRRARDFTASYIMREWLSMHKALYEAAFTPKPAILGQPEPIIGAVNAKNIH